MRILAIETSCDETGIAIVEARNLPFFTPKAIRVHADVLLSQAKLHAQYGGVFPNLARREHAKSIIPLITYALETAEFLKKKKIPRTLTSKEHTALEKIFSKETELFAQFKESLLSLEIPPIDAIAVTSGPGLEPALWVGINTAEGLGKLWNIPVIPVNHMEGHIMAALLEKTIEGHYTLTKPTYPALALLISGGHTELVLMPKKGEYQILGQTRDDAVGEAFDKVARMLGLDYPGGPEISRIAGEAPQGERIPDPLPRPMLKSGDFDFSFAGLKTAVLYRIKKMEPLDDTKRALIAKDFEDSCVEVLLAKTLTAGKQYSVKEIILGGGVTANKKIRATFKEAIARELSDTKLFIPNVHLSGDNGLMIGTAGLLHANKSQKHIIADGTMRLAKSATKTLAELRRGK